MQPGPAVPPTPPHETAPGLAARATFAGCPEMADPGRPDIHHHTRRLRLLERAGCRGSQAGRTPQVSPFPGPRRHVDRRKGERMRKGTAGLLRRLYRRSRADRWSSLFGQVAVYSFVVTAITGVLLLFYYKPSMTQGTYPGSLRELGGAP